ncbi:hypothetical protein [Dyella silvae]|uniref:hypothetical protein n=1 Tax=Dyella silvae TaxID=2994424 RepID=UPI002263C88B|nr:hypothetical protein [Dyella silvae]
MTRNSRWAALGLAMSLLVGFANAQGAAGRLVFEGSVVQDGCNADVPLWGAQGGVRSCGTSPAARAEYVEHTARATSETGMAMLDYFAGRPDGGTKYLVTRQYL